MTAPKRSRGGAITIARSCLCSGFASPSSTAPKMATRHLRFETSAMTGELLRNLTGPTLRMELDDRPGLTQRQQRAAAVDLAHGRQRPTSGRDDRDRVAEGVVLCAAEDFAGQIQPD